MTIYSRESNQKPSTFSQ